MQLFPKARFFPPLVSAKIVNAAHEVHELPFRKKTSEDTVDGRNPAPVNRWFYPIIYRASTIQGDAGFLPSTVCPQTATSLDRWTVCLESWKFLEDKQLMEIRLTFYTLFSDRPNHLFLQTQLCCQWEFQDPKLEVLYHIRPYFVGIFPETKALYRLCICPM